MAFTVKVTQAGSTAVGTALLLRVITGQSGSPAGNSAVGVTTTPSAAVTAAAASGSRVFVSNLGLTGTYTANAATTYLQNVSGAGLEFVAGWSAAAVGSSAGSVTYGGTATANSISCCVLEVEAATTLAQDASTPAGVSSSSATTVTTASFTPPAGSLLVAMAQSNGAAGVVTVAVTDTSGLGITWTENVKSNATGTGYSGIWTALVPGGASPRLASLMGRRSPASPAGAGRATGSFSR